MASESSVQAAVRLEYARRGYRLFRNNSGALKRTVPTRITPDMVGQVLDVAAPNAAPIRFGLGNDSPAVNERIKSSDLIGWSPTLVVPDMVGSCIARFVSIETKAPGWKLQLGDKRAQAQQRWIDMVVADGGEARFVQGVE
jgi:hypothetical protein